MSGEWEEKRGKGCAVKEQEERGPPKEQKKVFPVEERKYRKEFGRGRRRKKKKIP